MTKKGGREENERIGEDYNEQRGNERRREEENEEERQINQRSI